MPGAPWSYYGLLAVVVVVGGVVAWQYFVKRQGTKRVKVNPKAPAANDEQIAAKLTDNALMLLERLIVAKGKPREFQTLKLVLAGQANEDQVAQQTLDLLVSNGCAAKTGTSQYWVTPRGIRVGGIVKAAKKK